MHKIEAELQKATGKKQGELERQTFLKRLASAADHMEQDDFDALSKEAREWVHKALDQRSDDKEVSDFEGSAEAKEDETGKGEAEPEHDDAETDIDEESGEDPREDNNEDDYEGAEPKKKKTKGKKTMAKAKKAARTPKAAKTKTAKPAKVKKAARANGGTPNSTLIMRAAIKYPQKNPAELYDYLKKNGYKGTSGGVVTMKTYMSRAVRFLADEGFLNKEGHGLLPKKRGQAEADD